jgi:Domain of unknown function (DUF4037)
MRRALLAYFPRDLWLKKMACRCRAIAAHGQYNLWRAFGAATALPRTITGPASPGRPPRSSSSCAGHTAPSPSGCFARCAGILIDELEDRGLAVRRGSFLRD